MSIRWFPATKSSHCKLLQFVGKCFDICGGCMARYTVQTPHNQLRMFREVANAKVGSGNTMGQLFTCLFLYSTICRIDYSYRTVPHRIGLNFVCTIIHIYTTDGGLADHVLVEKNPGESDQYRLRINSPRSSSWQGLGASEASHHISSNLHNPHPPFSTF